MNVRATSAKCGCSTAYAVLAGLYLTARLQFAPDATLLSVAGANYMAYAKTTRKQICITDATFQEMQNLNADFQAFLGWLKRRGDRNEGKCLASLAAGCVPLAFITYQFIEIPFQRLGCLIATAAVANHRLFDSKTTAITLGILPVQSGKIDGE
jgi:hypothetical protein